MLTHSSCVNVTLSFKSAPAQNTESTLLDKIKALVGPFPLSACTASASFSSSATICRESALRVAGRFRASTLMWPVYGALCWETSMVFEDEDCVVF